MQEPIEEPPQYDDLDFENAVETKKSSRLWIKLAIATVALTIIAGCLTAGYLYTTNQPVSELSPTKITIASGTSVWEISQSLKEAGVVRSELTLFLTLRYLVDPTQIKASTYHFKTPKSTKEVAQILITGEFSNNLQSITFVEGMRAQDYAVVAARLPNVTESEFLELTTGLEGRLFPETYFVPPDITTTELVDILQSTHTERIATYRDQIQAHGLTVDEALVLASIIEREANTSESMGIVAGIFLNRLEIGMALQADASIEYVIDQPLGELPPGQLASELRELDSPYNTYLYSGLPPTPIGNPGETAIQAISNPIQTEYLYYITGDDGEFYYAETYDQHLANIARHLR